MQKMKKSRGFTLVELLVVLSVVAVVAGLAFPTFSQTLRDARLAVYTNNFLADLAVARSESIKRGKRVVLCKSSDGSECTTTGHWSDGWLIYEDTNNDGVRDEAESLIRYESKFPANWRLKGNFPIANYISYHPMGRTHLISGAFQAGTLTLCEIAVGSVPGTSIVISNTGRPRSARVTVSSCT
jgi:type IV fimbrial biogenesis protein FimT